MSLYGSLTKESFVVNSAALELDWLTGPELIPVSVA